MKLFTFILAIFSLFSGERTAPIPGMNAPAKEKFAGTTPCGQLIRPLHNIAPSTDCALVEWELTLLRDSVTQQPATYRLTGYSHYTLPDNNYSQPGIKSESTGKWSIVQGTGAHARSMIYQLTPAKSGTTLRFIKLSDDLLHLLDENGSYLRGDPFQSYTLNRITK
ncbi:hypothetical protein HB364_18285 [Pseudoflavitalea sp. X16]|uniref:copper resistance protein NlpE N-terminal domain-containing protein n=1 Tax=Paraflavitalea devenefica TaxID=2716334 RepID=UPI0014233EB2|nr:copper resistance protein NlpE N-terminal domain-containing protein [Paraflavitalea devenefica]NII27045.1 hypothetical protein [Paraflavitalea devenefica]